MNEPRKVLTPPATVLEYGGSNDPMPEPPLPVSLLLVTLMTNALLVLPIVRGSPLGALFECLGSLIRRVRADDWAAVMVLTPLLISVPLSIWTIRLARITRSSPSINSSGLERMIAYCLAMVSVSMTLLALCFTLTLGLSFVPSQLAGVVILMGGSFAAYRLLPLGGYRPSLIAANVAWSVNSAFSVLALHAEHSWNGGSVAGVVIILAHALVVARVFLEWQRRPAG